jgi:hypothetical protein
MWRAFVVALHDLDERYVELRGDEVDRFLADPDADLLSGAPRPSYVATSARRRVHSAGKVADAASGGLDLGPPDPSAVDAP